MDCDDTTAQISPGETEVTCDGLDNDCDALTEDDPDGDNDGAGVCSDCDDDDAERSPDFDEECGDEIDNDCNGEVDEECAVDYTGVWTTGSAVSFSCAGGAVNINTSTIAVEDYHPAIRVSMGTSQPGTMNGNFTSDTEFFAGRNIAGACTEDYRIEGEFIDENTFSGTLSLTFTDIYGLGLCYDCSSTLMAFSATR